MLKFALLGCLLLSLPVFAERLYAPVEKGCFANKGCAIIGYVVPAFKLTVINDVGVSLYGGNTGFLIATPKRQNAFGLGMAIYSLLNYKIGFDTHIPVIGRPFLSRVRSDIPPQDLLQFFHFGIYFEWIFVPQEDVHGGIRFLLSRGQFSSASPAPEKKIWIYQPEFFFQGNISHWLQYDWGIQFRFVLENQSHLTSFFDRSQIGTEFRLRFGWFDVEPEIVRVK